MSGFYVKAKTKERWDEICNIFEESGIKWANGSKATEKEELWDKYRTRTVIEFYGSKLMFAYISSTDYKKVKFKDLRKEIEKVKEKVKIMEQANKILEILGIDAEIVENN